MTPNDKSLMERLFPYFMLSLVSTAGFYGSLSWMLRNLVISEGIDFQISIPLLLVFFLLGALEDFLIQSSGKNLRSSAFSMIRESLFLGALLYIVLQIVESIGAGTLVFIPRGSSYVFAGIFFAFWISQALMLEKFMSRLDIWQIIQGKTGEELQNTLRGEQPFVASTFASMNSLKRSALLRILIISLSVFLYSAVMGSAGIGILVIAGVSLLSQLLLLGIVRIFLDDHGFLAAGCLPDTPQRTSRGQALAALLLAASLLSLPLVSESSLIAPETIAKLLESLFGLLRFEGASSWAEQEAFPFIQETPPALSWEEWTNQEPGENARFVMNFLDNIIKFALVFFLIWLLIWPLFRDPSVLAALKKLRLSKNFAEFLRLARSFFGIWLRGFFSGFFSLLALPFRAALGLLRGFRELLKGSGTRKRVQSEKLQERMIQQIVDMASGVEKSPEKKREIADLADVFLELIRLFGDRGLVIRLSHTIREIAEGMKTILLKDFESDDAGELSNHVKRISLIFEESLYSPVNIGAAALTECRRALDEIRKRLEPTGGGRSQASGEVI